jgi:amino acid adenylation domain-containing protein
MAARHAALRTTVHAGDGGPVGVLHERARVDLAVEDEAGEHVLTLRADPVALDDRSLGLVLLELLGRSPEVAFGPGPPGDEKRARAYWERRLAGDLGVLDLGVLDLGVLDLGVLDLGVLDLGVLDLGVLDLGVLDLGVLDLAPAGRRAERGATGVAATAELGAARRDRLRELAAACGVPVHVALLAAIQLLLRRYTGEPDIVIGLPVALGAGGLGWHASTIVLRQHLAGDGSARSLLRATAAVLAEAVEHRSHPIDARVELFQVAVVVDALVVPGADGLLADLALGQDGEGHVIGELTAWPLAPAEHPLRADLELVLRTVGDRPRVTFVHDPGRLAPPLVDCLRRDLLALIDQLASGPDRQALDLLERPAFEEPRRPEPVRPHVAGDAFVAFPARDVERSITARFLDQVHRAPAATAVAGDEHLTYGALACRASGVASAVRAIGAGRVGLLLDHGAPMIAAILGVLAAGGAYVPLDPSYPAERLAFMLAHSGAEAVLASRAHARLAAKLRPGLPVLDPDGLEADPDRLAGPATPDTPAYVLYTSGSTGRPKGVVQDHRNVLFQVRAHTNDHGVTRHDRLSLVASFSFDASVTDLFGALLNGAVVVPFDVRRHGVTRLAVALAERRVTVLHATPTVYRHLLAGLAAAETLPDVRLVLLGGEEVTARDVELGRRHLPGHCVLVNGYGATEVSFALRNPIAAGDPVGEGVVPLGWPLDGVGVALLAADGRPACLRGEIEVRSCHVASGYWADPELTAERFPTGPGGVRAYRTGDLGRRLADGRIVFAGRRDRQVKVRGHRVELGEVEAGLAAIPAVAEAVAVPAADGIVAYAVPAAGERIEPFGLRRELERVLPGFALPTTIVVLDRMPLTPTGKVDVRALPAPVADQGRPLVQPRDGIERAVAAAWCSALGLPAVDLEARFFDLGGHSLLLAGVQRQVERTLGVRVPLHRMLEHPTVESLARYLRGEVGERAELDRVEARMDRRRRAWTERR